MKRKACLVGINDYAPSGPGGPDLRGCVNDVRDIAHTLNALEIVPASPRTMHIITDARATKGAILDGFDWLLKDAANGDVLIFYYSGHGSQVPSVDSDDEIDGKDETICPHDFESAGMITDDDFRNRIKSIDPGVNLEIIFDSCHSGTMTKDIAVTASPTSEEGPIAYRYVDPPVDLGYFLDSTPTAEMKGLFKSRGGGTAKGAVQVPGLNHVLWAGCRDYQTSAEAPISGIYRGVFTYCFCQVLRKAGKDIKRRKLDSLVSADLRRMGFMQVPQLEGTKDSLSQQVFT